MSTAGVEGLPRTGGYVIDTEASTVRFRTRAMFGLLPVRGTFAISEGRITVGDPVEESAVRVSVAAATFDSGNTKRDDHVRSDDYLDVENHPEIVFVSEQAERSGEGGYLDGVLTVRGVTTPLEVAVDSVTVDGDRFTARGSAEVDRYAMGLTNAKGMTGRRLKVELQVVATAE
ncbi:YceI family protein [Streptomyces sp. NPDC005438]|uniref:YceI family protein n=1 Tax=Streptomyces sp. NPDC005438 TaxID=3156880 RepID=UPI0033A91DC4